MTWAPYGSLDAIRGDLTFSPAAASSPPWSPPTWMKTNGDTRGGSLKPEYFDAYALYFVKYIQAMKAEGIPIDAGIWRRFCAAAGSVGVPQPEIDATIGVV